MPTSGTWKVPFRGKFGAYDCAGGGDNRGGGGGGGQPQPKEYFQVESRPASAVVVARRVVPPFSVQSRQRDTRVAQPPRCNATRPRAEEQPTSFRR